MAGSTSKHLNVVELRELRIPVPTLSVQKQFAKFLDSIKRQRKNAVDAASELDTLFAAFNPPRSRARSSMARPPSIQRGRARRPSRCNSTRALRPTVSRQTRTKAGRRLWRSAATERRSPCAEHLCPHLLCAALNNAAQGLNNSVHGLNNSARWHAQRCSALAQSAQRLAQGCSALPALFLPVAERPALFSPWKRGCGLFRAFSGLSAAVLDDRGAPVRGHPL